MTQTLDVIAPAWGPVPIDELLARLDAAPRLAPFAEASLELTHRLSRALMTSAAGRGHAGLQALGFFLRRTETERLRRAFEKGLPDEVVAVPRGLVLHVPPANVDTLFAYSWAISLLCGNRNLVRLPSRPGPEGEALIGILTEVLGDTPGQAFVRYGHATEITERLSLASGARMIWGGDRTAANLRAIPSAPQSIDLVFADRTSLAVLDAAAVLALDADALAALARLAYADLYWFDQGGCASPRLYAWIGSEAEADQASERFCAALASEAEARGWRPEPSGAMSKLLAAQGQLADAPGTTWRRYRGLLDVLRFDQGTPPPTDHCGWGYLHEVVLPDLDGLTPLVSRRTQTLSSFGVAAADLRGLAQRLAGAGIDRMVPIGQALSFGAIWDGIDLPQALTRKVSVIT